MTLPWRESRNQQRERFADHERILLLEVDADRQDQRHAELVGKMDRILWAMVGVIITAATASIVGGLNLIIERSQ